MIKGRELQREEVKKVWSIDRREVIENIYSAAQGVLILRPDPCDLHGWPPGEPESYTPLLLDCYDRGGWFYGLFDDERLVGVAVLENKFIGEPPDRLQLKFLHIDNAYRHAGLGRRLFEMARRLARQKGAHHMYISATPSEHTINFYLSMGCRMAAKPDPELWALEPEDIHLECELS